MSPRSFVLLLATLLSPLSLTAQGCPHTKAKTILQSVSFYGTMDCGAPAIEIGGVSIRDKRKGCPLLAVFVPEHEIEEPASAETEVHVYTQMPVQTYFFDCEQSWLLFLPWGSSCKLDRVVSSGMVGRMTTVACGATQ